MNYAMNYVPSMTRRYKPLWVLVAVLPIAQGACASTPPPRSPSAVACLAPRPVTRTQRLRPLRPDDWFHLLVDRSLEGGNADCTGRALGWDEPEGCLESLEPAERLPPRPFREEEDIVIARLQDGTKLVWAITDRLSNGDGLGPVALVSESDELVHVLAIGSLRARARRARLKLETFGRAQVLFAEGEACTRPDEPATCQRSVTMLVRRGNRFEPTRLYGRNGICVGPAVIHLARQRTQPAHEGWVRRFELNSTLQVQPTQLVVTEQVVVSDFDPHRPGVPPRPVRRADAELLVRFIKGRFVVSDASLWTRMMENPEVTQ